MFSEEEINEALKRAENIPKRDNAGEFIDRLSMSFDVKMYKSGKQFL